MKKNLFSMLVISVLALAFVGCANPAGGSLSLGGVQVEIMLAEAQVEVVTLQSMQLETSS